MSNFTNTLVDFKLSSFNCRLHISFDWFLIEESIECIKNLNKSTLQRHTLASKSKTSQYRRVCNTKADWIVSIRCFKASPDISVRRSESKKYSSSPDSSISRSLKPLKFKYARSYQFPARHKIAMTSMWLQHNTHSNKFNGRAKRVLHILCILCTGA